MSHTPARASPAQDRSAETLVDQACDEFERLWREGKKPQIEAFLDKVPPPQQRALLAELLGIELHWRSQRGETAALQSYLDRFSQFAETIRCEFEKYEQESNSTERSTQSLKETLGASSRAALSAEPALPSRFGNYELLEQIGQGGMGAVYRAQQRGADRIVALKVIRHDLLGSLPAGSRRAAIERFLHEAQAAARLEHRHIVTVYEVGEVDGEQFYSMRYVEGQSLAEILRDGPIAARRAAGYLEPVARALHEAHRCGILHRDLKPQNILVDRHSDAALVVDFGLAKLTQVGDELTRAGELMGTPQYMSPEQVRDSTQVSPRSDVYSLGATLYYLMTGRPPFQAASPMETLRQVLDEEPAQPRQLNPAIDRDSETICMKCLQKEPSRRYDSAKSLADDLRRHLNFEPIEARPISRPARAWRWCRRNPAEAVLAGVATAFLILAIIFLIVGQLGTSAALQVAEANHRRAEENFRQARDAVDNFYTSVSEHTLLKQDGMQPLRAELLQKALEYYQQFLTQRGKDPTIRESLSASHFRVGHIVELIGTQQEALASYEQALQIQEKLVEEHSSDLDRLEELGNTLNAIGRVRHRMNQLDQSREAHQQALEVRRRLVSLDLENREFQRCLASSYMNFGLVEKDQGRFDDARRTLESSQRIRAELLRDHPDFLKAKRDFGMGYFNLANLARLTGDVAALEHDLSNATGVFEELLASDPRDHENQWRIATAYRLTADLKQHQKKPHEAREYYENAQRHIEALAAANPDVPRYQHELAGMHMNLGDLHRRSQQPTAAMQAFIHARDVLEPLFIQYPDVPRYRCDFAVACWAAGVQQKEARDYSLARASLEMAKNQLDVLTAQYPDDNELQLLQWRERVVRAIQELDAEQNED